MAETYRLIRDDGSVFSFDAANDISFSPSNSITSHPVESGVEVSDHIQPLPLNISLIATVTETPWVGADSSGQDRLDAARAWLETSRQQLLTLAGPRIGSVPNVALVGWQHTFTLRRSLGFRISLREIRVAQSGSVVISASSTTSTEEIAEDGTVTGVDNATEFADEVDVGDQGTTDVTEEQAAQIEEDKSTLASWWDSL